MNACGMTDRGITRDHNEDSIYYSTDPVGSYPNLFLVADGMGGHQAGDFASRFTVETMLSVLSDGSFSGAEGVVSAINKTNHMLLEHAARHSELSGMGTTLVLLTISEGHFLAANIGDSRLYLYRNGELTQISRDHSWVEEMVAAGKIERGSEMYLSKKNVITKAVGATEAIEPDLFEGECLPGDIFLMCSDGLSNMLSNEEIGETLAKGKDPVSRIARLIRNANEAGGRDNISAILIEV